jgi:putative acetyltransferase
MPIVVRRVPDVAGAEELQQAAALFAAYRDVLLAHNVPIDDFQAFKNEIAALPGPYAREARGCILLAFDDDNGSGAPGAPVGCVALKDLGAGVGEVKRLYVAPSARRRGVAEALCAALEDVARADFSFASLALDTLDRLPGALALYKKLRFELCGAYNNNPLPDARFLRKDLS